MANNQASIYNLDPGHISCIGGRTVLTCRHCAGNAPRYMEFHFLDLRLPPLSHNLHRGAICTSCDGRGFTIFICAHCNPVAATAAVRYNTTTSSTATANTTPGSSAPSSPGSLSRSHSTSYSSQFDPRNPLLRNGRDDTSCGRIETNTPRNLWQATCSHSASLHSCSCRLAAALSIFSEYLYMSSLYVSYYGYFPLVGLHWLQRLLVHALFLLGL